MGEQEVQMQSSLTNQEELKYPLDYSKYHINKDKLYQMNKKQKQQEEQQQ